MNALRPFRRPLRRRPPRVSTTRHGLAAAILLSAGAVCAEQTIEIRRAISTSGPVILLKDLVRSPSDLPQGWADRPIFRSPVPSKPEQYPLTTIAYALQHYPDMKNVTLRGDLNVTVQRDGIAIDASRVESAIRGYVAEQEECSNKYLEVEIVHIPTDLRVPKGSVEIHVTGSRILDANAGNSSFDLQIQAKDSPVQSTSVLACVRRMQEYWVTREPLEKGRVLATSNLERKLLRAGTASRRYVPCTEPVEGLELNRNLRSGQPIVRDDLSQPLCASRGEQVSIITQVKNLRIALRAKALSDGRLGERILCLNEQSKRRLVVQMTGPRVAALLNF
jgi:flagella basal body P-ring formation protein FlgA